MSARNATPDLDEASIALAKRRYYCLAVPLTLVTLLAIIAADMAIRHFVTKSSSPGLAFAARLIPYVFILPLMAWIWRGGMRLMEISGDMNRTLEQQSKLIQYWIGLGLVVYLAALSAPDVTFASVPHAWQWGLAILTILLFTFAMVSSQRTLACDPDEYRRHLQMRNAWHGMRALLPALIAGTILQSLNLIDHVEIRWGIYIVGAGIFYGRWRDRQQQMRDS